MDNTPTKRPRYWVALQRDSVIRIVFRSRTVPNEAEYKNYSAIIGPFRTLRGARFMAKYGANNPQLQTVDDAERAAKAALSADDGCDERHANEAQAGQRFGEWSELSDEDKADASILTARKERGLYCGEPDDQQFIYTITTRIPYFNKVKRFEIFDAAEAWCSAATGADILPSNETPGEQVYKIPEGTVTVRCEVRK